MGQKQLVSHFTAIYLSPIELTCDILHSAKRSLSGRNPVARNGHVRSFT